MRLTLPLICLSSLLALPAFGAELSADQLKAAEGVYLGDADCDLKERVHIQAIAERPGHFELRHRKLTYTLAPVVTTTGAVRLEDAQAGVVWLQIPAKSMLLNARQGRREVDGCMHAEQVADAATGTAPTSIGISEPAPATVASTAAR